jgi:hypothetical protein
MFYSELDRFVVEMKKEKQTKEFARMLKDLSKVLHDWEWLEDGDPNILHDVEMWKAKTEDKRRKKFEKSFNKFKNQWIREA